jgi:hypothetical protein
VLSFAVCCSSAPQLNQSTAAQRRLAPALLALSLRKTFLASTPASRGYLLQDRWTSSTIWTIAAVCGQIRAVAGSPR